MKKKYLAVIPILSAFFAGMTAYAAPPATNLDVAGAVSTVTESSTDQIVSKSTTFTMASYEEGDKITFENKEIPNSGAFTESETSYSYLNSITPVDRGDYTEFVVDAVPIYSISFHVDSAYAMPVDTLYYAKDASVTLPNVTMTNEDASFLGWSDSSGHTISSLTATEDTVLTARFSVPGDLRQIFLDSVNPFENGTPLETILSALPSYATLSLDNSTQLEVPISWQNTGFSYDPASQTAQEFSITGSVTLPDNVTNTRNIDLAVEAPISVYGKDTQMYTLSFDLNGAPGTAPSSARYEENERVILPADPFWYHHLFLGWSTTSNSSYANTGKTSLTMPGKDTTLYAIWGDEETFTLCFDANGGTGTLPEDITVYADEVAALPFQVSLQKPSAVFAGWSKNPDATSPEYTSAQNASLYLTEDTTLYAVYEELVEASITYDANGGSGTIPEDHTIYHAGDLVTVRFSSLSREHYTFLGWSTDAYAYAPAYATGGTTTFVMPNHDVTLYAVWRSNEQYSVTYHANGGTGAVPSDNRSYYTGDTVSVLFAPAPSKEHAIFVGWSASPDAQVPTFVSTKGTSFTMGTSNVDLYAVWEEEAHMQIRYSPGAGEDAPVDNTHYYDGQVVTVKFNPLPSCYGKTFLGWSDDPDAQVPDYTVSGSKTFTVSLSGESSLKVLYAVWETEKAKHITYDLNYVTLSGTTPCDSTDYYTGDIVYLDFNVTPKDPLYTFLGWAKTSDAYEPYYTKDGIRSITMATQDITLYAVYKMTTDIDGTATISYSPGTGTLRASYSQGRKVANSLSYDWLLDGEKVGTGSTFTPTKAGKYNVLVSDATKKYTGCVKSNSIELHSVSSSQIITLDTTNNLYEKGNLVTAKAVYTTTNMAFSKWTADGVTLSSDAAAKNPLSFTMPDKDVVLSYKTDQLFQVKVSGGVASSYKAKAGDKITLTASKVGGRVFEKWVPSGSASLNDPTSEKTSFTMPSANVTVSAVFKDEATLLKEKQAAAGVSKTGTSKKNTSGKKAVSAVTETNGDPIVYTVLSDGGIKDANIQVIHHSQGPLCETAFKLALGKWSMYTDYYNITVKESQPPIYETDSMVKLKLSIPSDLRKADRRFKMICVSKFGIPHTFEDLDEDPDTITIETNRFYAYALCFTDEPATGSDAADDVPTEDVETSTIHSVEDSTMNEDVEASSVHAASESQTGNVIYDVIGYTSVSMPTAVENGVDTLVRYNAM